MKAPREQDLVAACLQVLRLRGVFAWRNNSGAFVLGKAVGVRIPAERPNLARWFTEVSARPTARA